jgi:hypothetical protein
MLGLEGCEDKITRRKVVTSGGYEYSLPVVDFYKKVRSDAPLEAGDVAPKASMISI